MNKHLMTKIQEIKDLLSSDSSELSNFCEWGNFFKDAQTQKELQSTDQIVAQLIHEGERFIRYIVRIPPDTETTVHWHNCSEKCRVLSGTLYDTLKGRKLTLNQEIIYSKGEGHKHYNPSLTEWCVVLVDFHR